MCGIGGAVGIDDSQRELKEIIKQVCQNLHHRGPDDQGYFIGPGIALGSTRLSIRGLPLGKQPMTSNKVWIVFNGEIYNTETLRNKIHCNQWKTDSDTEVILKGYIQYGSAIFKELAGMFAFAIWDEPKATLFLVRDRWGEKPLYYAKISHGLVFASELTGLKPWKDLSWEVSLPNILAFLKWSYVPTPCSGWKDVLQLKPGYYLKWHHKTFELKRYYSPHLEVKHREVDELRDLIGSCVKQCSVSDQPIGAFLSGGIDSSLVVTYLQKCIPTFPVYSIDFEDKTYSEKKYSTTLCKKLGLKHILIKCDERFLAKHFDTIVSCYGEPFADESMVPTFCLAKRAKEDVDVVLTGDGADEFFHGYERYFFNHPSACYSDVFSSMDLLTRNFVLVKEMQTIVATPRLDFLKEWKSGNVHPYRARSFDDIQNYLVDDILTKLDRATMHVGLEARAPFLMPEITHVALNLPIKQLIENKKRGKWILRQAAEGLVPPAIINRKKQGFGVPLGNWFSGILKDWMRERLLSGVLTELKFFSLSGLEKLSQNPHGHSRAIFNLLVLESWWRKNIY
ncbi:Asparagine synthetase [glutamine-hydrolyzing] 1 [Candidatus Rhabdochlamydia oedothoracis]|uniref:asparagine synthase (glutamine-hydrolyzing) n=2 Tax=Candidatus Rhabdochlamydia TaxID=292833 RepID=A0ABX8UYV3_9BACT|nr:asparagine synthase (glutamine-hydrolyzing) [Candidatus Rhabdochlamydia oedothoracis]KAG6559962.1 Asparagine synthetase [glutamine-hydrolyzing] 1 [Candidatus Rhabdochlamydia sp. W815]MCL6756300.1 asparagine synthase (glutamine-hydrolyzing) [Candidatus Rhabdochlamydia oedothoracis]QYF48111.1 Asparagine synthetase [glutamine-hydrolyzing] 1 [Candidatus Rhabdochlamydia oedothoracis]